MSVGERIKSIRQEKEISQGRLAKALHVTPQAVSKWELGLASPDIALLPQIADYLGVSLEDLFDYVGQNKIKEIENIIYNQETINLEEFSSLVGYIDKLAKQSTNDYAKLMLGNLFIVYSKQLERRAIELGKSVLQNTPGNLEALNLILMGEHGFVYDWAGSRHGELNEYLEREFNRSRANKRMLSYLLDNLLDDGEYEIATHYLTHTKSALTAYQRIFYKLRLKEKQFTYESVKSEYDKLSVKAINDFEVLYSLGFVAAENDDYSSAIRYWNMSFETQEGEHYLDPLEQIACCYEKMGDFDNAIKVYMRLLDILQNDWEVYESENTIEYKFRIANLQLKKNHESNQIYPGGQKG